MTEHTTSGSISSTELRVAIRFLTDNVPSKPSQRAHLLARAFAKARLGRDLSDEADFIHCSSDFDSDASIITWVLCDFNIRDTITELRNIPVQYWRIDYNEEQIA